MDKILDNIYNIVVIFIKIYTMSVKKNKILLSLFVIGLVGFSCHKPNAPKEQETGLFTQHIGIDGIDRRYAIYIPQDYKNISLPIIFELHGGGVYIEDMTGESGHKTPFKLWMEIAENEKFIVVYPEGLNGSYGKPTWNDCRGDCQVSSNADDVHFIDTLISKISSEYQIDANRIYVSGLSNGGFMAQRIAIELNDKIAAVSSVVASKPAVSVCNNPPRPISILFMFGTDDNYMPYNGGYLSNPPSPSHGSVISVDETIEYWVNVNHTDTIPEYKVFPDLDTDDGGIVEKYSYKNGNNNTEVIFYKINGAGHSAPSIKERYSALFEQYFNKQNHDIEMTTEVWNFFKNKTLNLQTHSQ